MQTDPQPASTYAQATGGLQDLAQIIKAALEQILPETVVLHSIPWRVKAKVSADRKILAAPESYSSYTELHDLLGMRVITLFEDDLDAAEKAIRDVLDVDDARSMDKAESFKPDQFGYRSRHFVGSLAKERASLPENGRFRGRLIEIQLRTILQHTWAEIEHDLGYKPHRPISKTHRRRFSQLAAIMELADETFARLRREITDTETMAVQSYGQAPDAPLNIAALEAYVRKDSDFRSFDREIAIQLKSMLNPADTGMRQRMGYILDLATRAGWESIQDVVNALHKHRRRALEVAEALPVERRELLEMPSGKGLRPGFSLILLAETAVAEEPS